MRWRISAVLILLVSCALAFGSGSEGTRLVEASHHPGGMDAMSIDMIVAGNTNSAVGARQSCVRINENNLLDANEEDILAYSGGVTSATATTLSDANAGWATDQWSGNRVVVTAGTGAGQTRVISTNTLTQLTVTQVWTTTPDVTSSFEIRFNDALRLDITAEGVPAYNDGGTPANKADDTGGIVAYAFHLAYPAGVTIASHVSTESGVTLLTRNAGSSIFDASDSTPDSNGLFAADVLDSGDGTESGSGVLSRLVIQSTPGATTATHPLNLSQNVHVDVGTSPYTPDTTNGRAYVAINTDCDSDGDQWPDAAEVVIGTDPLDNCPDNDADDAWPPDFNKDGFVAGFDLSAVASVIGEFVEPNGPAPVRRDIGLPLDQAITGFDLSFLAARIGQGCT